MSGRGEVLRWVMLETSTTQSELSRISGVRQPSISQFLSGRTSLSDDMLDRLLSCMGYRLEIVRRPVKPELGRSVQRSWLLHRQLSKHLTSECLDSWCPTVLENLERLRLNVRGQPHLRNLDHWRQLIDERDLPGLHRVMTGLDTDSIEMREVSPMGGLLPQNERAEALRQAG
ncbi:MAG TPA: helix-turn-helix transcriptional regulator [Pseudonocardia sp.]